LAGDESRLTALIESIQGRDARLGDELQSKPEWGRARAFGEADSAESRLAQRSIVLRTGRPVLAVSHDEPLLTFTDAESEVWRERLQAARAVLLPAVRAGGRGELGNNPRFDWVGTGWLVKPDIVVTNRHVAQEFGKAGGGGFVFRPGANHFSMSASIDFLEEFGNREERPYRVTKILHIEDEDGPDLAFLQVEGDNLAEPIALAAKPAGDNQMVAAIGYPARDSRIPDQQLMERIFGDVYDKKRLAPGQIIGTIEGELQHDCSTLGGNSGSVLLDLATGQAVGIHFAGRFLDSNYAVPAKTLGERLEAVRSGEARRKPAPAALTAAGSGVAVTQMAATAGGTIPIKVTVEISLPQSMQPAVTVAPVDGGDRPDLVATEGAPEDYSGRAGYQEDFLGADHAVALPTIVRDADQILEFDFEGNTEHLLRYEHFSVVMNRQRRMCFYSAVNIDGQLSRKATRTGWRMDPRIDKSLQIMQECYGSPPKFSRGHMTRREDPVWGTPAEALLGNSDSMHVTNTTPQMQSFNAPVWLGLEDYALQNARHDKMKISVFTGPILRANDPVRFDIKIPRSFWKVIAFLHDDTGELTATGYTASQDDHLPEFVFGEFDTWQRPLTWIEEQAGISFGELTAHDPLSRGVEALPAPLTGFEQIRLRA
jgi:endonuclease G, mitochondrial